MKKIFISFRFVFSGIQAMRKLDIGKMILPKDQSLYVIKTLPCIKIIKQLLMMLFWWFRMVKS